MNELVLEKSGNVAEDRIDVFSKLLENRIVFVDNLLSDEATCNIIAVLLYLDKESQDKITLFINSEGGDIRNVFALYDAMNLIGAPLETFCMGSAMHESVLLLAAGEAGCRLATKNADICLSQINSSSGHYMGYGDLTTTKISHDKILKDNEAFLKELSKVTGRAVGQLRKDTERQLFLTSSQAIKHGIVDKVV